MNNLNNLNSITWSEYRNKLIAFNQSECDRLSGRNLGIEEKLYELSRHCQQLQAQLIYTIELLARRELGGTSLT